MSAATRGFLSGVGEERGQVEAGEAVDELVLLLA